jgi:hypothetical protein
MTTNELQDTISTWAEDTFNHNTHGIALHLLREAVELCIAAGLGWEDIRGNAQVALTKGFDTGKEYDLAEEAADVAILTLTLAGYECFSLSDAVVRKHAINLRRVWNKPDVFGVSEHLGEGEEVPAAK